MTSSLTNPVAIPLIRQRINKVIRLAKGSRTSNPRILSVMASPPTITTGSSSGITSPKTFLIRNSAGTAITTPNPFDVCCGSPYFNSGSGQICFPCVSYPASTGANVDNAAGKQANAWRVGCVSDSRYVAWQLLGFNSYRFLVDDGTGLRYVSLTATAAPSSGGIQYIILDFGSRLASGRTIYIEGQSSSAIVGVQVSATSSVWKPLLGNRMKVGVIGDSISTGTGATLQGNAFSYVMGDVLGARDTWAIGIGGTGYIQTAVSGTIWNYSGHSSDWTSQTDWDLLVFTGGNNDNGNTQSAITTAVQSLLVTTRSALPDVPIVVFGPDGDQGQSGLTTTEAGIKGAVTNINTPTIRFEPLVTYVEGVSTQSDTGGELFGTGKVGTTTGDGNVDFYRGSDGVHPNDEGHLYRGFNRAMRVLNALEQM